MKQSSEPTSFTLSSERELLSVQPILVARYENEQLQITFFGHSPALRIPQQTIRQPTGNSPTFPFALAPQTYHLTPRTSHLLKVLHQHQVAASDRPACTESTDHPAKLSGHHYGLFQSRDGLDLPGGKLRN